MISSQEQTSQGHAKKAQSTQLQIGRCLFLIAVRDGLAERQGRIPRRNFWAARNENDFRPSLFPLDMSRGCRRHKLIEEDENKTTLLSLFGRVTGGCA